MQRLAFFGGLTVFFVLLCHPEALWAEGSQILRSAQDDTQSEVLGTPSESDILYSDQYFLSATRSLQPIRRVTDNVTVITREELDQWPVGDLDEALGLINGIVILDDGNIGQVATAQIHGSKPREVRVMVDGITFNATTTGGIADISQIPLDMVEKIEVVKGASSSVWGSALGGVINIITRPTGKGLIPHGNTSLTFGEFSTQRERGEVSGRLGPLGYYGFGSYVESGGFRPNSDELEKRAFLKSDLPLTDILKLSGSFGYSGSRISEFDLPDLTLSFKRKVYSRYGSAGLDAAWTDSLRSNFTYKISERNFRRDTFLLPLRTLFQFGKARSMIHEVSFLNIWDITEKQTVVVGSDIGVELFTEAAFRPTTATPTTVNINKRATRQGYYANYQLTWWRFDVVLGSRLDATNSYGTNFDPSAGLAFHLPFWGTVFRTNVARAFNAPSLVDRYESIIGTTTIANPDLKAEKAIVYNVGLETEPWKGVHGKAVFFQTWLEDSIQTITRSDGLRQPVNITRERRNGFETETKLGPWRGFWAAYGTAYVRAFSPSGHLEDRPRFTQDIKCNYGRELWGWKLNFHLAGRYMDLKKYSGFTDPVDQVFIFDGKVVVTLPKLLYGNFSIFLEGENLFNEDFSFDGGRDPIPERNFEAGVKYAF